MLRPAAFLALASLTIAACGGSTDADPQATSASAGAPSGASGGAGAGGVVEAAGAAGAAGEAQASGGQSTGAGGEAQAGAGGSAGAIAAGGGAGEAQAGGAAGASGGSSTSGLPCSIEALLSSRCHDCHGSKPSYGAPMSLVTLDDLKKPSPVDPSVTIAERAFTRMKDVKKPMPEPPRPRATVDELSLFESWLDAGLPARDEADVCETGGQGGGGPVASCEPNVMLEPDGDFEMPETVADRYVCWGAELAGAPDKRHITGIVPFIDNTTIVHHILLFEIPESENEPKTPHTCDQLFPITWRAIYAWAPGAGAYQLPEQAGFAIEPSKTARYAVQIHYSNIAHHKGERDRTRVGLCSTDKPRKFDADIMWMGGVDFSLPAHQESTYECSYTFNLNLSKYLPVHAFQAWPHMHQLGTRLETVVESPGGQVQSLGLAEPFDFYDQLTRPVDATIYPGDTVKTRCSWDNTTDGKVRFGEATFEEMCFNLVSYYPRIALPQYTGIATAYLSTCNKL